MFWRFCFLYDTFFSRNKNLQNSKVANIATDFFSLTVGVLWILKSHCNRFMVL